MRLYLVRHAVTAETGRRLSGRIPGIHLSTEGEEMAAAIAKQLSPQQLAAIYTSPIERCRETASAIARGRSIRPRTEKAFVEADYGSWSGRSLRSLYKLKAWGRLMSSASRFRFPDGETLGEVQYRAVAAVERLGDRHRGEAIVVASHSDVIRTILAHYLGTPLDLIHRIPVINHVVDPGRWR